MKKFILIALLCLANPLYALASGAADADLLKAKLAKFNLINAEFSQVVSNYEGEVLNKSQGKVTISRPGKFRWEVVSPEEELIVSDGKTMWLYSPFIEQVTLLNLSDAVADTPFVLLSGANEKQWQNYLVSRNNNQFTVKDSDPQQNKNTFVFEFDGAGNISKFVVIEEQGQRSEFTLIHKPLTKKLDVGYFDFQIPQGVEIDDQR